MRYSFWGAFNRCCTVFYGNFLFVMYLRGKVLPLVSAVEMFREALMGFSAYISRGMDRGWGHYGSMFIPPETHLSSICGAQKSNWVFFVWDGGAGVN